MTCPKYNVFGDMKDWLIRKMIRQLEKWEVARFPIPDSTLEYASYSTLDKESYGSEYGKWFTYRDQLKDDKRNGDWYIAYKWHTTIGSVWHTSYIFARKISSQ